MITFYYLEMVLHHFKKQITKNKLTIKVKEPKPIDYSHRFVYLLKKRITRRVIIFWNWCSSATSTRRGGNRKQKTHKTLD